jgi:probable F420-dependent oxidoreductase
VGGGFPAQGRNGVKYTVTLPTDQVGQGEEFVTARAVAEMAAAVEAAGFAACNVTDHPFPPADWLGNGGHHPLDPLVTLAVAASATTRLRLHTHVFIPAYRNPFIAAKGIATLDALAGGRVILGVAAGYLAGEFAALGAPYEDRGAALDAAISAMRRAWTGRDVAADGAGWSARGNVMLPRPSAAPHPPIWIGGNSRAARLRAAAVGQGWSPFPARQGLAAATGTATLDGPEVLRRGIDELRSAAERHGRTEPLDICITPFSHPHSRPALDPAQLVAEAASLAALGVTWLAVRLPAPSRADFLRNVERFGKRVIGAPE